MPNRSVLYELVIHLDSGGWGGISRFRTDKLGAARDFWQAMYDGMAEAFAEGLAEPMPTKNKG